MEVQLTAGEVLTTDCIRMLQIVTLCWFILCQYRSACWPIPCVKVSNVEIVSFWGTRETRISWAAIC